MASSRESEKVRIICISDTHNQTPKLPPGDVLIHAGDLTNQGSLSELQKVVKWLEWLEYGIKIVIAGNHDMTLDQPYYAQRHSKLDEGASYTSQECIDLLRSSPTITYLEHEYKEVKLIRSKTGREARFKVFGSPYSPVDGPWAFGYESANARSLWSSIPADADIVVTHTPPKSYCDQGPSGPEGCEALLDVLGEVRPKLHVCGHKHYGRGVERVRWDVHETSASSSDQLETLRWQDPGAGPGNKKISKIDLTAKGGAALRNRDDGRATVPYASSEGTQPVVGIPVLRGGNEAIIDADEAQGTVMLGRIGRRETCIINASYVASSYKQPKCFNKPIVVDMDVLMWPTGG